MFKEIAACLSPPVSHWRHLRCSRWQTAGPHWPTRPPGRTGWCECTPGLCVSAEDTQSSHRLAVHSGQPDRTETNKQCQCDVSL